MKKPIVSLLFGDYRRLLQQKTKAEIAKISVCGSDWSALLLQIRDEMSRVENPTEIIVSIEMPATEAALSAKSVCNLLSLLTDPYSAPKPNVMWGVAEVDGTEFRVVVYAG